MTWSAKMSIAYSRLLADADHPQHRHLRLRHHHPVNNRRSISGTLAPLVALTVHPLQQRKPTSDRFIPISLASQAPSASSYHYHLVHV